MASDGIQDTAVTDDSKRCVATEDTSCGTPLFISLRRSADYGGAAFAECALLPGLDGAAYTTVWLYQCKRQALTPTESLLPWRMPPGATSCCAPSTSGRAWPSWPGITP